MKTRAKLLSLLFALTFIFTGCEALDTESAISSSVSSAVETSTPSPTPTATPTPSPSPTPTPEPMPSPTPAPTPVPVDLASIPEYAGAPYVDVNGNVPYFLDTDYTTESFESYAELDKLGRCGTAYACIGKDIMPTGERGDISSITPSGWQSVNYEGVVDGGYLYNRCHLIGYQLSGENANKQNLITGTRYLNIEGMLPFENMVADYVHETKNHVLYRVTPVFSGDNLLASGVLMEGRSVEDEGAGILFCVYAYNVQPSISINYATGESVYIEPEPTPEPEPAQPIGTDYILNTNTRKFHYPSCSSVKRMKESNKQYYTGTRDEVIGMGYDSCQRCYP